MKRVTIAALTLVTVTLAAVGVRIATRPPVRPRLVLAVVGPMTGKNSFQGEATLAAVRLAVAEENRRGGVHGREIQVVAFDDASDPQRAAEQARAAAASGALAVLGHRSSDACIAAGKIYKELQIPALTGGATGVDITRDNPWYFRLLFDALAQGRFLAGYTRHVLGLERVGVVFARAASGRELADGYRAGAALAGVAVLREWSFDGSSATLGAALDVIVAEAAACVDCQAFVVAGAEVNSKAVIERLRDRGVRLPIIAGQSVGRLGFNEHFRDLPRERAQPGFYTDNLYAAALSLPDTAGPLGQEFERNFRRRYGKEPDAAAAAFYDGTRLVIGASRALSLSGADVAGDRRRLRDVLAGVASPENAFEGATGSIFFDASRNAVKPIPVGRFTRGELVSAPTQLELLPDPARVPRFADLESRGAIVRFDDQVYARTQVVHVGLDVVSIPEVDLRAGTFAADLFVWFRGAGDFDTSGIDFANADEPVELGEPIWKRGQGDMTTVTFRVQGSFRARYDFHEYPFDRQTLAIEIRHKSQTRSSLILALDRLGLATADGGFDPLARLSAGDVLGRNPSWRLRSALYYQDTARSLLTLGEIGVRSSGTGLEYSRVVAAITVGRDVTSYGIKNLIPLLLIIIILYVSYLLPYEEIGTRSTIDITAILTVAVLYQQLGSELPNIGYLVNMDYGFYVVLGLSMFATLETVAVFLLARAERTRLCRWLDLSGLVLTPVVLLVLGWVVFRRYG